MTPEIRYMIVFAAGVLVGYTWLAVKLWRRVRGYRGGYTPTHAPKRPRLPRGGSALVYPSGRVYGPGVHIKLEALDAGPLTPHPSAGAPPRTKPTKGVERP